ncbi:MAG: NAD(P)H-dependent oxidoreductase [Oscillospiraceae bacterium]
MKIAVFNGSPKGDNSVTLQTVLWIKKNFPEDSFEFLNVAQLLRQYENNMEPAIAAANSADLLLFSYPVYTFLAPYQLHRFIELLKASGCKIAGKFAAQVSTSKHFFDVTAQNFIEENCGDMGLLYLGGLSADMDDLLSKKGREEAIGFWRYVHFCASENICSPPAAKAHRAAPPIYTQCLPEAPKSKAFEVVVVTDCHADDENLLAMISDFCRSFPYNVHIVNIRDFPFKGGCLGCFRCAANGKCVYTDGFDVFLREQIQSCDAIVYAFCVRDHSMGSSFKLYDDRQFCNGHRTVMMGRPTGYLISGNYSDEQNLRMVLEGRSEVGQNFLAGIATDEADTSAAIERLILSLSYALETKLSLPQNYLGVGGTKIFRDLIYVMRGLMREDHRFYKKNKIYDFPQKKVGTILKMKFVGSLMSFEFVRKKMGSKMNDEIIKPYKKAISEN